MLVKRRLGLFSETVFRFGAEISVTCTLVLSTQNKADLLSRVPKSWLGEALGRAIAAFSAHDLEASYRQHHFEVTRFTEVAQHSAAAMYKETSDPTSSIDLGSHELLRICEGDRRLDGKM